jgi:hypothetical protein
LTDDFPVREANLVSALELLEVIPDHIEGSNERTCPDNLRWMMGRVIREINSFPVDKSGRWIGFVQGVLALSGHLSVDGERNSSRARYHAAYEATGQVVPATMQMGDEK